MTAVERHCTATKATSDPQSWSPRVWTGRDSDLEAGAEGWSERQEQSCCERAKRSSKDAGATEGEPGLATTSASAEPQQAHSPATGRSTQQERAAFVGSFEPQAEASPAHDIAPRIAIKAIQVSRRWWGGRAMA